MQSKQLMPIIDVYNVFTDGFLVDETGSLCFISLIGKDTAIQELRARWSLPLNQGGLSDFQVETENSSIRLHMGNPESLEFLSGRLNTNLFGQLVQVFVYKTLAQRPDFANRRALQLFNAVASENDLDQSSKLWTLIKHLSPLPLLDEWRELIIDLFTSKGWIKSVPGEGNISAFEVTLPEEELACLLKTNIQNGALLAEANERGVFINEAHASLELSEDSEAIISSPDDESDITALFGNVIHAYTRSDAIDDGFLVDVSDTPEARDAGFVVPVALTSEVWEKYVTWPEEDHNQDQTARLFDVLNMARFAIMRSKESENTLLYKLACVPSNSTSFIAKEVTLKLVSGPGDEGEHVMTIMMPHES